MAKLPYPFTAEYINTKGLDFALQELVSNGFDAQTEHGAAFSFDYDVARKRLKLTNKGITLSRETLLMGGGQKSTHKGIIGVHKEGMKLAFLVLAREGLHVVVRNGRNEDWRPLYEFNETWNSKVLVVDVIKAKRQVENFEIEIVGIEPELWNIVQGRFLRMQQVGEIVETPEGSVLYDEAYIGKIFVRGVENCLRDTLTVGYNLLNPVPSRDRDTLSDDVIDAETALIWRTMVSDAQVSMRAIYDRMNRGGREAMALRWNYSTDLVDRLAEEFTARHGRDVILCRTAGETVEVEHHGMTGVVVSEALYGLLAKRVTTLAALADSRRFDTVKDYSLEELTAAERDVFLSTTRLFTHLFGEKMRRIAVVDFRDPKLAGTHQGEAIRLARKALTSRGRTMRVLVHEFAHDYGDDGSASHQDRIEALWEAIYEARERPEWNAPSKPETATS